MSLQPGQEISVSAPASSANLGPGFDCIGVAIDLRNTVVVRAGAGNVTIVGEGSTDNVGMPALPTDSSNFVIATFERACGMNHSEFDIECTNSIPLARGLGSSTAAAATALIAGWEVAGKRWTPEMLFQELALIDGHADNAGACVFGGCVIASLDDAGVARHLQLPIDPLIASEDPLTPLFVIPDWMLSTDKARAALPDSYERSKTIQAISNAAFLVSALTQGNAGLLTELLHSDVVHEPARGGLIPELSLLRNALADCPVLGITISGAGPTLMVWSLRSNVELAALAVRDTAQAHGLKVDIRQLDISQCGATVT